MIEFLTSLLILVLSFGLLGQPTLTPEEIVARFEENITQVEAPPASPAPLSQDVNEPNENGPGSVQLELNGDGPAETNTEKIAVYNTSSGITIGGVAAVAVENAPPLVDCEDPSVAELCDAQEEVIHPPEPTPTPEPTPEPTPSPLPLASPLPIPSPFPKPPFDCDPFPPADGHFQPQGPYPCLVL